MKKRIGLFGYGLLALSACGGAALVNAQNVNDAASETRCEAVAYGAPDGSNLHAYHECMRDAGLIE